MKKLKALILTGLVLSLSAGITILIYNNLYENVKAMILKPFKKPFQLKKIIKLPFGKHK